MLPVFFGYCQDFLIGFFVSDIDDIIVSTFCDNTERCLRIICQYPSVTDGCVVMEEIIDPYVIAPSDCLFRDVVPSAFNPCLDSFNGKLRRIEPEIKQGDRVACALGHAYGFQQCARRQCCLNCKITSFLEKISDLQKHVSTCLNGGFFRVERRKAFGEFVGIDEFAAFQHFRKQGI